MNIPLRPNAPGGLRFKNLDPQTTRQLLQVAYARMWRHNMVSRGVNRSAPGGPRYRSEVNRRVQLDRCRKAEALRNMRVLRRRRDDHRARPPSGCPGLGCQRSSSTVSAEAPRQLGVEGVEGADLREELGRPGSWPRPGQLVAPSLVLGLQRRHMDESQRALGAAKLANLGAGRPLPAPPKRPQRRARRPTPASAGWYVNAASDRGSGAGRHGQRRNRPEIAQRVLRDPQRKET